jgi:hypothetical protein
MQGCLSSIISYTTRIFINVRWVLDSILDVSLLVHLSRAKVSKAVIVGSIFTSVAYIFQLIDQTLLNLRLSFKACRYCK